MSGDLRKGRLGMRNNAVAVVVGLGIGALIAVAVLVAAGIVPGGDAAAPAASSVFTPSLIGLRATDTARITAVVPAPSVDTPPEAVVARRAAGERLTAPELVKLVRPSLVHIATEAVATDAVSRLIPGGGVGTGFAIDGEGRIVTNNHVIAGARRIVVTLPDGRTFDAEVVGEDPQSDLAVIQVDAPGLPPLVLGSSRALDPGETVVAIGHALDLPGGPTVTVGVVSALDRAIANIGPRRLTLSGLIQTDASISPGNSGGPLLNMLGEVVGVNTAAAGAGYGIGFAIAIDAAKPVLDALIREGRVVRGFLGISTATITRSIARQAGFPVDSGVFVAAVTPGSPADSADLRVGDILQKINDDPVPDAGTLTRLLAKHAPGTTVEIAFIRPTRNGGSEALSADVTLGERPDQ